MNLRELIKTEQEMIKEADLEYSEAVNLARVKRNKVIDNINHEKILKDFLKIMNGEKESSHSCDNCRPSYYDDAWFTDEGITMRIDADHPNDIIDSDWTFEEVEEILNSSKD